MEIYACFFTPLSALFLSVSRVLRDALVFLWAGRGSDLSKLGVFLSRHVAFVPTFNGIFALFANWTCYKISYVHSFIRADMRRFRPVTSCQTRDSSKLPSPVLWFHNTERLSGHPLSCFYLSLSRWYCWKTSSLFVPPNYFPYMPYGCFVLGGHRDS